MAKTSLKQAAAFAKSLALTCAACWALATGQALAQAEPKLLPQDHASVKTVAGAWDVETAAGRKCRVQLNTKGTRSDLVIGATAACKMSIPALAQATLWGLSDDGKLLFRSADGKIISQFAREGAGPMRGKLGADVASLTPANGRYPDVVKQAPAVAATAPQRATQITAVFKTQVPAADTLPGVYAMLRQQGREVCRVMLDSKPATKSGQNQARFSAPCADSGLATFDPVAWRFSDNRVFLVAKKGHEVGFSYDTEGLWRRDPPVGTPLQLKKIN